MRYAALVACLVSGCAMSTTMPSECDRFCDGFLHCLEDEGRCTAVDAPALRAFCGTECLDLAAALTEADREATVGCLACLEAEVEPGMCTNAFLGDAFTGPCAAACAGPGTRFGMSFGDRLNAETPPLYTCTP